MTAQRYRHTSAMRRKSEESGSECNGSSALTNLTDSASHRRTPLPLPRAAGLDRVRCTIDPVRLIPPSKPPGCSRQAPATCYTGAMMDELEFRRAAESALDSLKRYLFEREEEEDSGFEVEEQNGVLNVVFDDPAGKFVITPNAPVRQIWISALSTSFKLDWDAEDKAFKLPRTGEQLAPLVDRLIQEHQEM